MTEEGFRIARETVVGAGHAMRDVVTAHLVVVQDQIPRWLLHLVGVTRDATAIENRLDVAVELDVLDSLLEAQAGLVLDIPLLAGLVFLLGGQQGRMRDGIKNRIVRLWSPQAPL